MAERLDVLLRVILSRLFRNEFKGGDADAFVDSKLEEITRAVIRLSELYTQRRVDIRHNLLQEPDIRLAYLAYFLPSNFLKIKFIFQEIWLHQQVKDLFPEHVRILDLGCGPGTNLLGCLDFFSQQVTLPARIECVGVDSLESNLQDAHHLFDLLSVGLPAAAAPSDRTREGALASLDRPLASLKTYQADLSRPLKLQVTQPFDFILIGNVLNELFIGEDKPIEKRARRVAALIEDWLAPAGFLILMEPALRGTSREMLQVRDRLLDMLPLTVYSPCVHSQPCPAVAPGCTSDWCHEDHTWETPNWIRQIDQRSGLRKSSLKYSYVVLNRLGLSIRDAVVEAARPELDVARNQVWRVVSDALEERGKSAVYLCGTEGRFRVTRLDKHFSAMNADFESLNRGQVVSTGCLSKKSAIDLRVEPETPVRILMGTRKPC